MLPEPEPRLMMPTCVRCGKEVPVALWWWVRGRLEFWCPTCSQLALAGAIPADREAPLRYPVKEEG